MINDQKVREVADRLELIEKSKVDNICTMLRDRANIGVEGEGRWPSWGRNNPTVYQFGERVADSLQTAVKDGIMYGPLKRKELPLKDFKVITNDGQTRTKQQGMYHHGPLLSPQDYAGERGGVFTK